ncbi:hypothetical protein ABZZ20_33845 [Streptomyces sp. NPDC006430]|uniref:hypothetical protein n=1 Tax=Streptomyces sp. NPDC006430 TaxID=3154299 RepID=UPI0033A005E4
MYTFILQPRRKEAVLTFVKRTAVTILTAMAFTLFGGMATVLARESDSSVST